MQQQQEPLQSEYLYREFPSFSTNAIHCGQRDEQIHGSVNVPIHLSTTFKQNVPGVAESMFYYSRCENPTRAAFEECIAKLEGNTHAIAFSSGLGAFTTIIQLLKTGERILCSNVSYGGVLNYLRTYSRDHHGIEVNFVDMTIIQKVEENLSENTTMVWIETPNNPLVQIVDIQAVSKLVKAYNPKILVVVDNTFATPYLQTPSELGADITVNSGTKYLSGHSDILFGTLSCNKQLSFPLHFSAKSIGFCPSVFDCYMMLRSIRTLEIRVRQHCKNAYMLAKYLEQHPKVEKVYYPGLESHPQHQLAKQQMRGSGGMLSFYLKNAAINDVTKLMQSLKLFTLAASLGGVDSLICSPRLQTHEDESIEYCRSIGITDQLMRVSVGLENIEDLIADFENALAQVDV